MSEKFNEWLRTNRLVKEEKGFKGTLILVDHWAHKVVLTLAEIAEVLMLAILFVTVLMRYVFNTGIGWAEEVPRLLVLLFSFIACAIGVRDHMHISVTVIYSRLKSEKIKRAMDVFSEICTLVCGLVLLIYGYRYMHRLMGVTGTLPMTGWPTWIQYLPAPLAGFLMTFDSILFLTGVLDPDDLLYSEKEIDYVELVRKRDSKEGK